MVDRRQRETGDALETLARKSTEEWRIEELRLTSEQTGDDQLAVSVDAGWQKRGSGKAYDSMSGHCSMIGKYTGKITNYKVRSRSCRVCSSASSRNETAGDHDCRKNWDGSSKAMEQDMIVEMVSECNEKGFKTGTVIRDDDSTTIARLRRHVDVNIKKISDKNHVKKNFSKTLYKLQNANKNLTATIIKYLKKCFNYVIAQNHGNTIEMEKGLKSLSRHPFGDHSMCNKSWCRFVTNTQEIYKSLPNGKPIQDQRLKETLTEVFDSYTQHAEKLASLGSTQANESFNKTVGSKAPKSHHYSGSASLNYRVAGSVLQKNIGYSYVSLVHKRMGLSPGAHTMRLATLKDLQTRKRRAIATTRKAKKRRLALKSKKSKSYAACELREGDSYSSCVALKTHDITEIPAPRIPPADFEIPIDVRYVCFDLETTGLGRNSHITQMAAVCGDSQWQCYVIPKIPVSISASEVTGITVQNGRMFHNGKFVESSDVSSALDAFIDFLSTIGSGICLYGHNIKSFDCHVLFNALEAVGKIEKFATFVSGFLDTKLLFRSLHPGLSSYTQQSLVTFFLQQEYSAHNAMDDVSVLQKLYISHVIKEESKKKASFSVASALFSYESLKLAATNLPSLQSLLKDKILSKTMCKKMAASNLNYSALKLAYSRGEEEGIRQVLSESCGKGPRVTKSSKIIAAISQHFRNSCNHNES